MYCYLFIIETKNRTLEETAALFDGEEAAEQIEQAAAEHANGIEEVSGEITEKRSESISSNRLKV